MRKRLDIRKEIAIYRIVQEALTNVAKYADVAEAHVNVEDQSETIQVTIWDEGIGFSEQSQGEGVGLFSMEERARGVGGWMSVTSSPEQGTSIQLTIPV